MSDGHVGRQQTLTVAAGDETLTVPWWTRAELDEPQTCSTPGCDCQATEIVIRGSCNEQDNYVLAKYYQREHVIVFRCAGCGGVMGGVRVAADA